MAHIGFWIVQGLGRRVEGLGFGLRQDEPHMGKRSNTSPLIRSIAITVIAPEYGVNSALIYLQESCVVPITGWALTQPIHASKP